MKIYTKTGDKGQTSLYTGERVCKSHPFLEALGTIDECNCAVGAAISHLPSQGLTQTREQLEIIQHALFDLGAALATPRSTASDTKLSLTRFDESATKHLEHWIDAMEKTLPPLHTFILPGGHPVGALLHLARSICRRAERTVIPLNSKGDVTDCILVYINRLSDYLFVASRFVNHQLKSPETLWEHHKAVRSTALKSRRGRPQAANEA